MAQQPRQFSIEKQEYRGALPDGLPPVQMPQGQAGQAAAAGFGALADKFSAWANQDAKFEGERDAKIAAAEGRYDRTERGTIYGRAYDATALDAQVTSVTATYRNETLRLFDEHRNNPAGLTAALERAARDAEGVLPAEARAGFRARASDIGIALQRQALANQQSVRQDEARATLIRRSAENERQQAQLLSVSPSDPAAEAAVRQASSDQVEHLRGMVASGLLDASKAEQLIQAERQAVEARIIQARAATLRTPEEVDAYRADLRSRFQRGELAGLTDIAGVDDALTKMAQQRRVEGDRQLREYQGKVDDALTRATRGQPPTTAEMAVLEADAQRIGPRGQAALETMRVRATLAQQMATMSMPERDALYQRLRQEAERAAAPDVSSLPAGMRNNNPGNIKYVAGLHSRYEGVVGPSRNTDQGDPQAVFASPEAGMRAAYLLARRKYDGGRVSAAQLIAGNGGWTPGNMAAATNIARMAGVGVNDDLGLNDPSRAARFMRALVNQEHGEAPGRAYSDQMIADAVSGARLPPPRAPGAMPRAASEALQWVRQQNDADRAAMNADLLGYAGDRGLLVGGPAPVDMNAAPDALSAQIRARVDQVDAVAPRLGQASPSYLRPDDRAALQGVMTSGGERALSTVQAIIRGAGPRATTILKEIGGDAPALAHAAAISAATGDNAFALGVSNAIAARNVPGAPRDRANRADFEEVTRTTFGRSMNALPEVERARTMAAAQAFFEVEVRQRNLDPQGSEAKELVREAVQRARGMVTVNDVAYGGIGSYMPPQNWTRAEQVQVLPSIRQDRFAAVIGALTDADLGPEGRRPVLSSGKPMTAADLRRMIPEFVGAGYSWRLPTLHDNRATPVLDQSGRPYVLDLQSLLPTLRQRVPDAIR